ncbi:MAG TPA: Rid family detoxifying hydrolase [Rectinemataceae bacterium]|nr:Rid family detoxifying hydrolase [Rectinemataceae bacterium]
MSKLCFNAKIAPAALGPYSHAVISGELVFLSGQLGLDPATNALAPGGIEAETRQALANVSSILAEMNLSLDNVVKTTVFLRDMADFARMNAIYAEFFPGNFPARSAVQVAALPKNGAVEIEAIVSSGTPAADGVASRRVSG